MQQIRDGEKVDNFYFIQQALTKINLLAQTYIEVNATIWLAKGEHFFIQCDDSTLNDTKYN